MDDKTTKRSKKSKVSPRRKTLPKGKEALNKEGKSNSEFGQLFSTINQGMAIHEIIYNSSGKAIDYKIIDINPIYERIAGVSKKDVIGKTPREIYNLEKPPYLDIYASVASSGKSVSFETYFEPKDLYLSIFVFSTKAGTFTTLFSDITTQKKAGESLKNANQKTSDILGSLQTDFYVLDSNWNFIFASKTFTSRIGKEPKDFIGRNIWKMFPKHIGTEFEENLREAMGKKEMRRFEIGGKYTDSYYEMVVFPSEDGITVLGSDITKRKQMENALRESEERFRLVMRHAPVSVAVQDLDLKYIWAFNQITAQPDEIVDHYDREIFTPEETAQVTEMKKRVIKEDTDLSIQRWFDRPSGKIFLAIYWEPIHDTFGHVIGVGSTTLDMTSVKMAEEALRESEAKAKALIKYAPTGIYEIDFRGPKFLSINDATLSLSGYTREEMFTLGPLGILDDDSKKKFAERIKRQLAGEKLEDTIEYRMKRKDGTLAYIVLNVAFSKTNPYTALVIGHDITDRIESENNLKESEEKYRKLFETMNEGSILAEVVTNDQGGPVDYRFLDVNSAGEKYFGRPRSKIIGQTYRAIGGEKADPEWIEKLDGVALTGAPLSLDSYAPVGGQWVSLKAYSPRSGQFAAVFENITERKKAEDGLKQREERFRVLIENLRSGVALIDESGQFSVYNSSFLRLFGLSKDSDIMSVNNQKWSDWKVYEQDGKTLLHVDEHPVRKSALTGKPVRNKLVGVSLPSGGELIWMVINAEPIINLDGTLQYIIVTYYDITERKNVEEQLRNRAEELETVMNLVPVAIWVAHDPKCSNITGNRTANEFYEAEEGENVSAGPAPGEPIPSRRFFSNGKELKAEELPMQEAAARNIDIQGSEFNVMLPSGKSRTLWGSASPLRDDGGQVRGVVAAFLDITERKQAEEDLKHYTAELESANKELESYSYSISHDLRAPLRTLDGFSEMVIEEYGDKLDETGKEYLNRIRKAGQIMSQLTEDILKLSRITRAEMHRDKVNLSEMAGYIADELKATQTDRQAEFIITPDIVVNGDKALLEILLHNLLENSWKYTRKCLNVRIEMGVNRQDGKNVYFIKDNGVGFDMQYKDKLFQPFQRLHSSKDYPGTGIGLATAQRVIHRHGGDIWVESEIDKGTTFYFTLE